MACHKNREGDGVDSDAGFRHEGVNNTDMSRLRSFLFAVLVAAALLGPNSPAQNTLGAMANRLAYLDGSDPFYPHLGFARLTTPQWLGDPAAQAAIILSIDDMQTPQRYEQFLRPILSRLQKIDGRAPVSIMCMKVDPQEPHWQQFLAEGLSLEAHTLTHPCPILGKSDFPAAAQNFFGSILGVDAVPHNKAVAFRTPYCDRFDSASPRLYAELFNETNAAGQFLTIDSSVTDFPTKEDASLPRELVTDAHGGDKFEKYLPPNAFSTMIDNYPYPYVIGRLCWEFPCAAPSDGAAFHFQGSSNPVTLADWKAGLEATVLKKGVFTLVFHPWGFSGNDQETSLVDYADKKYGAKVKFLNFREAQDRLNQNLLAGQPLRAANGEDNGVRLLDLNNDGFMDVVIANEQLRKTRVWNPKQQRWRETGFPTSLVSVEASGHRYDAGVRFGVVTPDGRAAMLVRNETAAGAWIFDGQQWVEKPSLLNGLELEGQPIYTSWKHRDRGVRLRCLGPGGLCYLIVGNESQNGVFAWSPRKHRWTRLAYGLPPNTSIVDEEGRDNGLRFVDIDGDGYADVLFSNAKRFSLHLFAPKAPESQAGWTRTVSEGLRGAPGEIPMIVRDGPHRNNGAWFRSGSLWVQNEDTSVLTNFVDHRSFKQLLEATVH